MITLYGTLTEHSRDYLSEFYSSANHLVITDYWLAKNPTTPIVANDYDQIIFDLTHNPVCKKSLARCMRYSGPKTILINDYALRHKHSDIVFFPVVVVSCNGADSRYPWIFDQSIDVNTKTISVSCVNNRPAEHRLLLLSHLYPALADEILITQCAPYHHIDQSQFSSDLKQWVESHRHAFPITMPDDPPFPCNDTGIASPAFAKTALNVITETTTTDLFVSEKTCKALAANQFFIILGGPGIVAVLRDWGFDTFDDIIPHRDWDHEPDAAVRAERIAAFLKQQPRQPWLELWHSLLPRLEANRRRLFSPEFLTFLKQPITQHSTAHNWL